jgi:hypothetical protein
MKTKSKNIGCDVELGGIKDVATIMKIGTMIVIVGGGYWFFKKWGTFKFFANFDKNVKDIAKAPGEFTRAEGDVIDNAIYQANEALEIYKEKKGSDAMYTKLIAEWNPLKTKALKTQIEKIGFFTFYGSGKSNKEKVANEVQGFVKKVLKEIVNVNKLQGLNACVPCLPLLFL